MSLYETIVMHFTNLDNHISGKVLESERELLNIEGKERVRKD